MTTRLPSAHELQALGTVLCVYPGRSGGELAGWSRARRAAYVSALDSDGLRESICFFDAQDRICWRVYLLPDTDLLAWERLARALPARCDGRELRGGIAERLRRRWAGDAGVGWQAGVLRLHALPGGPGYAALSILAASLAPLSDLGGDVARRILRSEGVDGIAAIDDCCCRQASARATIRASATDPAPQADVPLIRFNVRTQA